MEKKVQGGLINFMRPGGRLINTRVVRDIETGRILERDAYLDRGPVAECAFVQRLTSLPWLGVPFQNDTLQLSTGISLSTTGAQTNSLTGITPTFTRGAVRVKIYGAGGTTPTIIMCQVVVTDGTTFVGIGTVNPTTALALSTSASSGSPYTNSGNITSSVITGGGYDWLFPFCVDINCNQVSILTTLGGTTPTAKLDFEVAAVS
jgi:hypothetical protein